MTFVLVILLAQGWGVMTRHLVFVGNLGHLGSLAPLAPRIPLAPLSGTTC